jgi:hypothetical protein
MPRRVLRQFEAVCVSYESTINNKPDQRKQVKPKRNFDRNKRSAHWLAINHYQLICKGNIDTKNRSRRPWRNRCDKVTHQ